MKKILLSSLVLTLVATVTFTTPASAANIESSTITQVVKDATVLQPATKGRKAARVNDVFGVPDVLRTGANSRVEMIAEDQTVTRVGANTIFSFEPGKREINLQKGSVLFNSPTGKGGGTIRTAAATAAVQGTTLIVVTTQNGGFKTLLLEGCGSVKSANGQSRSFCAGQMVYALPGGSLSGILTFQLRDQVGASQLVNGFRQQLPSKEKIEKAVVKQQKQIAKGQLVKTGLLASDDPNLAFKADVIARSVLIEKTVSSSEAEPVDPVANALVTDAIIDSPTLEAARVFSFDTAATLGSPVGSDGSAQGIGYFYARNTTIRTDRIDLSPYSDTANAGFFFLSTQDFIVEQEVFVDGAGLPVGFIAGGTFKFAPGTGILFNSPEAYVYSFGFPTGLTGTDTASGGSTTLSMTSGGFSNEFGNLSIFGPAIDWNGTVAYADGGNLLISATSNVSMTDVGFGAGGSASLSTTGNVTVNGASVFGRSVTISGGEMVAINGASFSGSSRPEQFPGVASVDISAKNLLGINFTSFNVSDVSLSAQTLVLRNVDFQSGSNVRLRSASGQLAPNPNTNQPVRFGDVNFIQNVRHGGSPAEFAVSGGSIIISR